MTSYIASYIREKQLFSPTDQLLLAVSGGMDSMVLLHILLELDYRPGVIHANFQLRAAEAEADEVFVREAAERHGLPFFSRRFATKAYAEEHQYSIQEAARNLRYAYFAEIKQQHGFDYLLTAHHLDDRLETFWLNFTRGTGWRGLTSLLAKRDDVRRPLLGVNRSEIQAYQEAHAVPFREDASNAEDKYRRNYFRHHVLPALYAWTPELAERSRINFTHLEAMLRLYEERINTYRKELFTVAGATVSVDLPALRQHPSSATLGHELFSPYGFTGEDVRQLLEASPGTLLASTSYDLLVQEQTAVLRPRLENTADFPLSWPEDQLAISYSSGDWLTKTWSPVPAQFESEDRRVYVNPEVLVWPLQIRYWQDGDRFAPLGMGGQQQKLQDFFTNNKIDRLQRQRVPLLLNGDGAIIWIVGYRLDERFKVPAGVEQVISFAWR